MKFEEALNEWLEANPSISRESLEEVPEDKRSVDLSEIITTAERASCGLDYVRDVGKYSEWRAVRQTQIITDLVRNGTVVGSTVTNMRPGDLIQFLMNLDGRNYDGYRC